MKNSKIFFLLLVVLGVPRVVWSQQDLPYYLYDRGEGVTTSLFGTYIEKDQWLVYPFYEYIKKSKDEYHGSELGGVGEADFLGSSIENEFGLFVAYGFSDNLALEVETILYGDIEFTKDSEDTVTGIPGLIEESGLGAVETNLRWRWREETEDRAEYFSNLEIEYPLQKNKLLLGAGDWEVSLGLARVKGHSWGTITTRISLGYDAGENEVAFGEYAIEYLKKVSEKFRWVATLEGEDDELSLISEMQWRIQKNAFWKIGTGVGLTEKSDDVSPEVGLMMVF